jgi:hypothetical protein
MAEGLAHDLGVNAGAEESRSRGGDPWNRIGGSPAQRIMLRNALEIESGMSGRPSPRIEDHAVILPSLSEEEAALGLVVPLLP